MDTISLFLIELIKTHPYLGTLVAAIGTCRLFMKPIMTAIRSIVKATPSTRDDEILEQVESSKWWSAIQFVVDWLTSVPLPPNPPKK